MLMKLHPYWKHYVMIYDVEELLLCLRYFYPSNNKIEKHLIFLIWTFFKNKILFILTMKKQQNRFVWNELPYDKNMQN